jgi:ATP-dependent exoDNAse (exonuclease V) beta subunit
MEWRKRVGDAEANKIGKKATSGGNKFHTFTEQYLKNEEPIIQSLIEKNRFDQFKVLLESIDNIRMQETGLWSHHLRMAGRVDCVAEWNGKLSIIDFKTSLRTKQKSYIESYFMQAASYSIMFEERTQIPVPNLVILISVEDDVPQVFEEKRNNWVEKLLYYRDLYESNNR